MVADVIHWKRVAKANLLKVYDVKVLCSFVGHFVIDVELESYHAVFNSFWFWFLKRIHVQVEMLYSIRDQSLDLVLIVFDRSVAVESPLEECNGV
jgi:hypothetical protein